MPDPALYLKLRYNLEADSFETETNIAPDKIEDVVAEFLRSQMGLGKDNCEPAPGPLYEIKIELDLSDDTFKVSSNTNSSSLTTGIIAHYLNAGIAQG